MRSEKDAKEKGLVHRLSFFFFFFFVSYILFVFFFRVTQLIKVSNSKKNGAGNITESLFPNHQRFPSSSLLCFSVAGEFPSPSPSRAFMLASAFDPSQIIFRRPTLRIVLIIHRASSCSVRAPSPGNAPGSRRTRVGDQWARCPYQSFHEVQVGIARGGQGGFGAYLRQIFRVRARFCLYTEIA